MVRGLVVLGGSSHPNLVDTICTHLGISPARIHISKFSNGETRVEIGESVRDKDVFIIQTGAGTVNDNLIELLITISACKTASARRVTAVLPLFPYSRQPDVPYNKIGAPLARNLPKPAQADGSKYTFDSRPSTPLPGDEHKGLGNNGTNHLHKKLNGLAISGSGKGRARNNTGDSISSENASYFDDTNGAAPAPTSAPTTNSATQPPALPVQRGYQSWVAQAGTLVADLLTCAGANHVISVELHDSQYQGFFDIPVDNLYGRHLLKKYIQQQILPQCGSENCVIVSPDAGGAKRATNIADSLDLPFALIHKERRPTAAQDRQNATMLLVGDVQGRTAILIDDLADTSNTITRAAKLLKKEGAHTVYALVTHGVLSGDAVERINASALDRVVVTNSVPQDQHLQKCPKLEVLEVGSVLAESIRRVHHGESISALFQYD